MRRGTIPSVLLSLAVVAALAMPAAAAGHPAALDHVGSTTKVVLVSTSSWSATSGTATLWQKSGGTWRSVRSMSARVGRNGFSRSHREGDGTTPAGTYVLRSAFGSRGNPGTYLPFRATNARSCWSGSRADYNRYVERACTSADESLWHARASAYRYAVVIGYDDSPAVYPDGSAIFLHVTLGTATSGCVALPLNDEIATLRWATPGTKIVMGPHADAA